MKKNILNAGFGLFLAATAINAGAVNAPVSINIPNGSFEGLSANYTVPTLNVVNKTNGAWDFQLSGLVALAGSVQIGTAAVVNGPAPVDGTNELAINLPVGVGTTVTLSQVLPVAWQPYSTYTLTVSLATGSTANVLGSSALSLKAGSTNVAMVSSNTLVSLLNGYTGYKTATVTYTTGATVPTNNIGISFSVPSVANVGGNVYVDNFALTVVANPLQLTMTPGGPNISFSATGTPNAQFELITSTNLPTAPSTWTSLMTSHFDVNGSFAGQIPIDHVTPYRSFRLVER